MNKEHARLNLSQIVSILNGYALTNFLVDGTLLGAIRNGDFIDHDTDIDVGVLAEEWTPLVLSNVLSALTEKGFTVHALYGVLGVYFEVTLKRNNIKCDLFFYRKDGDMRVFHAFRNGGRKLPEDVIAYGYPAALIENTTQITFCGDTYTIPANAETVLQTKYGPNWRTPVKTWDWADGPFNKIENA